MAKHKFGITIIPSKSMEELIKILSLQNKVEYRSLISLGNQAKQENKNIIHFGV